MGSEMAQCIILWKPGDLSLIPRNYIKDGESQLDKDAFLPPRVLKQHMHT